jgi:predicted Zn-dependent protease
VARRCQDYDAVRIHLQRASALGFSRELLEREQWLCMAQAGQLREAEPHLAALLRDERGEGAEICEAYVNGYLSTYQPAKASLLLGAWEQDFPDDPMPHLIRGGLHATAQRWVEALASYRQALARDPASSEAAIRMADVLVELRKFEEAIDWYRKGQMEAVQNLQARLGVAHCLDALGKRDEARQSLTALATDYPSSPPVMFALAQFELTARSDVRARELLERAFRLDPYNPAICTALAGILHRAGEVDEAETLSCKARHLVAENTRAGQLLEGIIGQPEDVDIRFELGTMQLERGNHREGVMWLKSVLELQPDHAGAREALRRHESDKNGIVTEGSHRPAMPIPGLVR